MPTAVYVDMADTDTGLGEAMLSEAGFAIRHLDTRDPDQIVRGCHDADALLVGYAPMNEAVLSQLPQLHIVSLLAAGVDNVDLDAANRLGVWVANVPGVATDDVATHALTLTLAMLRQLPTYQHLARENWMGRGDYPPPKVSELTLGLIGVGQIGRRFADYAAPLFGRIVGFDPALDPSVSSQSGAVTLMSREEVLEVADVVSLHVPLTDATTNMVDKDFLGSMKRGSYLVNVSRGGLVDSSALADALDRGDIRQAALDTIDQEPAPANHPLMGNDRVIVTPHVAYYSTYTEVEYVRVQAQNVLSWWSAGHPTHTVVRPNTERPRVAQ